jgi:hypothetical protein
MRVPGRLIGVLGAMAMLGCGTEPDGTPLVGQWGFDPGVSLVATDSTVDLDLTCATFHADRALIPNDDGRFSVSGRDFQPFGMLERDARLTGQVMGTHLLVHLTVEGVTANSPTYELIPGLIPTSEVECPS